MAFWGGLHEINFQNICQVQQEMYASITIGP